jgi:para-nitrobenzyl esterase
MAMLKGFCGPLLLSLALIEVSLAAPTTVAIEGGAVRGVADHGLIVYKGIPYAAPPVGTRRWAAPTPPHPWRGTLVANHFPSQCPQLGPPLPTMPKEHGSEDCLYLNLWTPAERPAQPLPVIVFLYGGGFQRGSASTPLYASGGLTRATGIILVNLNYRLGYLGFLAHPQLSAESDHHVSGNYALLDAIAGLQWVKQNIAAFGGDPNNVTLMGHSAGSYMVNQLMISPPAVGLFQRAIAESGAHMIPSGAPYSFAHLPDAEKAGVAFASALGAKSIGDLRKVPASRLIHVEFHGVPGVDSTNEQLPIVDGFVVPGTAYDLYERGDQAKVPLLLGSNEDENESNSAEPLDVEEYKRTLHEKYGEFAERFLSLFPADSAEQAGRSKTQLGATMLYGWNMWTWAKLNARSSSKPTFLYRFSSDFGTAHGSELPMVFQYPFGGRWSEAQRAVGTAVLSYWANFARTGNPNGEGLPPWPAFTPQDNLVFSLGRTFQAGPAPDLAALMLIDEYQRSIKTSR